MANPETWNMQNEHNRFLRLVVSDCEVAKRLIPQTEHLLQLCPTGYSSRSEGRDHHPAIDASVFGDEENRTSSFRTAHEMTVSTTPKVRQVAIITQLGKKRNLSYGLRHMTNVNIACSRPGEIEHQVRSGKKELEKSTTVRSCC